MRIVMITGEFYPCIKGGAGVSATLLVNELWKRGYDVNVYLFCNKKTLINNEKIYLFKHIDGYKKPYWPINTLLTSFQLKNRLNKYEIIHIYDTYKLASIGLLKKIAKLKNKTIATLNDINIALMNYEFYLKNNYNIKPSNTTYIKTLLYAFYYPYFKIHQKLSKKIDIYIAISPLVKKIYVQAGFPSEKIKIIPNMYDPRYLSRIEFLQRKIRKNKRKTILYVGRIEKEKGIDILLIALKYLVKEFKHTNIQLWIIGDGSYKKQLLKLARKLQLTNYTRFLGKIPYEKLPEYYLKAHIFVYPSRWPEPFGRSIIEAMLAGLTVIVPDIYLLSKITGSCGLYFRTGDAYNLAEILNIALNKNSLEVGQHCKKYAKTTYSPEKIVEKILKLYNHIS